MVTDLESAKKAAYDRRKDAENARRKGQAAHAREIEVGEPENRARREACRANLRGFLEAYHAATFALAWSDDHLTVITALQTAILEGGQFAFAMPRGSGKTSLTVGAAEWALLYGHRRFVMVIGATESAAVQLLDLIRSDLEAEGTLLAADFPEVCDPIIALEGIANRAAGQLHHGQRTSITITADEIVLPTIEGSVASGAIVRVAGLLGRIRGQIARLPDGGKIRPDFAIIDDPQTDESAASVTQCARREHVLAGSVLGLAGPGKKIAAVATVTVIQAGDVADNLLDRTKHPEWNGRRTKLLYQEPSATKLWEQYAEIRADSLLQHGDIRDATAFYAANRQALDEGAKVAWAARFNPDEISALQHAMNLRLQDATSFAAEFQNEPLVARASADEALLDASTIARRLNGLGEAVVPATATRLTGGIDVQQGLLYWSVVAWRDDFTGSVIAYGTHPKQEAEHFIYADAKNTLQHLHPNAGVEGALLAGLQTLTDALLGTEWRREDGNVLRLSRLLVDANWRQSTEIVYMLCRRSRFAGHLMPAHGQGFGLSAKPISEWAKSPGDRAGFGWRIPIESAPRHVRFDSGAWKTFVHARLAMMPGDAGSLTMFGKAPARHRMLAEHLTAEERERMRGPSRVVDVWTLRNHRDNHLLDCVVMAAVAASVEGVSLDGFRTARPQPRRTGPEPQREETRRLWRRTM